MYEKLPVELDLALRIIASKRKFSPKKTYIEKLLVAGFITQNFFGGWMVNSRGKQYLKEHPNL